MDKEPFIRLVLPESVLGENGLTYFERILLIDIVSLCKKNGYCWPTNRYFMKKYDCTKPTVSKIISSLSKFGYIYSSYYFNYYSFSYELFNSNELSFLYNSGFSILILLCFVSLMYCYMQLFNKKEMNVKIRTIIFNITLIIVSNIIVVFSLNNKYSSCQFILNFFTLFITEQLCQLFSLKWIKKKEIKSILKNHEYLEDYLKDKQNLQNLKNSIEN